MALSRSNGSIFTLRVGKSGVKDLQFPASFRNSNSSKASTRKQVIFRRQRTMENTANQRQLSASDPISSWTDLNFPQHFKFIYYRNRGPHIE